MNSGDVYWITGLSGAGKTTIGRLIYNELAAVKPNVVFLDGDELREVFGNDLGHSRADRIKSAMRNARLCKMLSEQGIDVVCATISLFHECQQWNRENIPGYIEIFLDVPITTLTERDRKGVYSKESDIVGVHIEPEKPVQPDIVIINDGSDSADNVVRKIMTKANGFLEDTKECQ